MDDMPRPVLVADDQPDVIAAIRLLLRSAGFNGPINLHLEHSNLLGSDVGKWKLDITRDRFIAIVKRDLDALRTMLRDAQLN